MPHVDLTPVDVHPPVRVEELPILALPHDSGVELRFAWPDPVAAAVFRRAGQLWLVFHARAARIAADRTSIRRHARGLFESMGQEPHERATIFRLSLSDQVTARALFDGKGWRILLSDRAPFPRDAATRTVGRGLLLPGIEAWIDVTDPLVGDRLGVGLTTNAELGSSTGRSFVDLELLPAALGRVWVPRAGDLEAQIVQDGLLLSRTEGLHVAPSPDSGNALGGHEPVRAFDTLDEDEHAPASHPSPSDRREREPTGHPTSSDEAGAGADHADTHGSAGSGPTATAAADHAPADAPREARTGTGTDARTDARGEEASTTTDDEALLGLKAAPLLANQTLLHRRRELIGRLVDERAERRLGTLIDLARLHLALGQGAEARTYLARADLLTADDPALAGAMGARRRALAAVAGLLMGREPDAAVLLDAHHDDDPEIRLWRSAFDLGDPSEDPGPADDRAMIDVLQGYSVPLQIELGLRLVDRFSTAGRANAAFTLLGRLERLEKSDPDEARFRYAQGSVFAQDGDLDAAVDRWRKGVTRARGITLLRLRAALAQAEVATGALDLEAAVEQLRADRASWRGHPEEWELQRRLGALESQAGHAARALESWQKAVEQAPSPRLAGEIIDDMQRLFVEVLTSSGGWRRSPLQALALYRRYRELLPEGEAGDRLVSTLIDELEGAGFTEAAIAMLERRSTFAGGDAFGDRAAALRIARMQLAGDADEKALATLRDVADLDAGERDEATIIRARALLALDRPDEASALLRTSTDPRADRLKARIAIADDDTDTILREIPPLLASTDAASLDESQYANAVVSLALAHAGRGDAQEVRQLVPDHEDRPLDDRNRALLQTLASLTRERNAPATLDDLNGVDTSALRRFLD